MSRYLLKLWKVDGREKTLVAEDTYDSQEETAQEIGLAAGSIVAEAVETNG
jgi:hypothetical protein